MRTGAGRNRSVLPNVDKGTDELRGWASRWVLQAGSMGLVGRLDRFTGGRRCVLWALQPFSFAHFDMNQGRLATKGRELRIY